MNDYFFKIPGWITEKEARFLYDFIKNKVGCILEIGCLFGKSTSCICEAIKDSENKNLFDSFDINFKNGQSFIEFYNSVHKVTGCGVPDLVNDECFSKGKSILDVTREYLNSFGLLDFVNLYEGDFRKIENKKYDVIFCDAMHDKNEIDLNLPDIIRLSNNNFNWIFHDMTDELIEYVVRLSNAKNTQFVDSMGVFQNR